MRNLMLPAALLVNALPASAQESRPSVEVTWHGQAQVQFNTTSVDGERLGDPEAEIASSTFDMRRVRISADAEIGEWIHGAVGADFAGGRIRLTDAWMGFDVAEGFMIRAGQFKKPFSLLELTSSTRILPIERGVAIREVAAALDQDVDANPDRLARFAGEVLVGEHYEMLSTLGYVGRDIGAAVQARAGAFGIEAGVFNGEGGDRRDINDGKSFAARVTLKPWAGLPLVFGGAGTRRETHVDGEGVAGSVFEVDAEWGASRATGLHVQLEAGAGDNLIGGSLRSAQGILAWFVQTDGRIEGVEPLFRTSWGDPRTENSGDEAWFITPGINVYFHGRNRLMLNWERFMPSGTHGFQPVSGLRAQAQLYF